MQANEASFHVIEQGEGATVLFCHRFPDTAETWRSQMRAVAEAGYQAVALDMRGFGASYAPRLAGATKHQALKFGKIAQLPGHRLYQFYYV